MDDLDHSMHIAEFDWTSFYDESEECSLLQPSLACPDNLSLSDSEDSENSSSVSSTGQREKQQSLGVNSDGAESSAAGCSTEEESCMKLLMKLNERGTRGEQAEEDGVTQVDSEICLDCPAGDTLSTKELHVKTAEDITEEINDNTINTLQTDAIQVQCSGVSKELEKKAGDLQTEVDNSRNEPDPLCHQTQPNVNEPRATDRVMSEDASSVAPRVEKERWFVTVNDSPARQRVRVTSMKKKRRQKKPCKKSHSLCNHGEEKSHANDLEISKDKCESQGGRNMGGFTQSNQNLLQNSGWHQSSEINPESLSDSLPMSCEEDNVSENLIISHSPKENITEPMTQRNEERGSSASTSYDTFTPKNSPQLENTDEFEDGVEFFSSHSYDSETYMSAAESVEETQHLLMENIQPVDLIQLQCSAPVMLQTNSANADSTQGRQMHSCDSTASCNVADSNYEYTDVDPALTFPSAGQRADNMPNDNCACDDNTHSTVLHTVSHTPGLQKHKINLSESGSSSGDQLSPLPVPELTVTPCSAANNPEAYAKAAGHTQPVYAISAFWDEMEKLTINDILQLRMGRSTPPWETQETATAYVDESPTGHGTVGDAVPYNLPDGGLMDMSDTADSDYFTQPDESKPDRSSCEFSTSDFEEEYWQFIGASRNPSPDPHSKNQQRTNDSPFLSQEEDEEEESTSSEGKETPVPLEDFAGQCFEEQDSHILSKLAWPRQTTKSKSMHNLQALIKEDLTLPFGSDDSGLLLSSCQSLGENMVLKVSDSLETLIPASFLSTTEILDEHYQISFPEVFEYFFTEGEPKNDSGCVAVYDPEDIPVAPVFDYTLCTFRDELSFFSLHDSQRSEEKPIPIFSCSRPKRRELTFPKLNYVFLSADYEAEEEMDNLSPIRVVSHSFIQANHCGTSAAGAGRSRDWKGLISMRKIRFHDKGSIWCRRPGAWVFPVVAERIERKDPPVTVLTQGRVSSTPSQFREVAVQQSILGTIPTTRQEGIFSTLKQSDMCLVCIAFASWVLRSSDPEAADAWKAALLANVSALSAIQYLRQYVKKTAPSSR
ncbi:uro-adherence factor A [Trachinotus anak]|uniref:uro-adherence factor A n=1 Tax=Trachinotus anak TaxID=443729 RepID=UPI0039F19659